MRWKSALILFIVLVCGRAGHPGDDSQTGSSSKTDKALQTSLNDRFWMNPATGGQVNSLAAKDHFVVSVDVQKEVKKYGVTDLFVQTAVELRLREKGIKTQEGPPPKDVNGVARSRYAGLLEVTLSGSRTEVADLTAVSVSASFYQDVALLGTETPVFALASTWSRGGFILLVGTQNVREACERALEVVVDAFSTDWLATRPTQKAQTRNDPNDRKHERKDD